MRTDQKFPIVGIGASAGGIEALEGFFRGLPSNSGAAFVIVIHLSAERQSFLSEVLSRYTPLPVSAATEGTKVVPNRVYVILPNMLLGIDGGRLVFKARPAGRIQDFKPIDFFFGALAKDQGECAISVVLSGADGDGTLGTKLIKEAGGVTLAQIPDGHGPAYPDMPKTAIAAGFVDLALPVDQMGSKITEIVSDFYRDVLVSPNGPEDASLEGARQELYSLLRNQAGHDFSGYKVKTFDRRVQRRIHIAQLGSIDAYVEELRRNPKEVQALFRDLLISVTDFFRDKEPFEKLKQLVIPKLFEGRGPDQPVRVWVPGCATGEEVYTVGILFREHMATLKIPSPVQIFATDIDEKALAVARLARYPEEFLRNVKGDRRRFFVPDGNAFMISKEVRELCIFSTHSLIRDPPFSHIDLISCRNLLIYFGPDIQHDVIPIFHYSLRPSGHLLLGTSENITQFPELFVPVDKKNRIFRARDDVPTSHPAVLFNSSKVQRHNEWAAGAESRASSVARHEIESQVLERLAPVHVVVNNEGEVIHYSAKTGKYFEPPVGAPTRQLIAIARKGLRLDLRTAVRDCIQSGTKCIRQHVHLDTDDGRKQLVTISVEPIPSRNRDNPLLLVSFLDEGQPETAEQTEARFAKTSGEEGAAQLERELHETRDRLQSQIEEYESALEELKSSNEELVSLNEEMQSTNEELEASKEEMQSLNEELHTVNLELTAKVDALDRANNDLKNLLASTEIATVFLDAALNIRMFTPGISRIFNILPSDRGRPLTHITSRFPMPGLAKDVNHVLSSGDRLERAAKDEAGAHLLIRLNPYHNSDSIIDGVVVSFIELSERP